MLSVDGCCTNPIPLLAKLLRWLVCCRSSDTIGAGARAARPDRSLWRGGGVLGGIYIPPSH